MVEKPQPDPVPIDDPPPHPAEPLQIDTPVIDMQDLEHKSGHHTRMYDKDVRIEPRMDRMEVHHSAKDDEDALLALEQIEKSLRGQLQAKQ